MNMLPHVTRGRLQNVAGVIKLDSEMSGLSAWDPLNHRGPCKREAGRSESEIWMLTAFKC